MAIYIGNQKQKVIVDGITCYLKIVESTMIQDAAEVVLSSDDWVLLDSDGLYLMVKEEE